MTERLAIRPLRSGSSGNLTLVEHGRTRLLIDAGLPSRKGLTRALSEAGHDWDEIDALIVSHLHGDHIHPAAVDCCARHEVPIYLHERNLRPFSRRVLSRVPWPADLRPFDGTEFSVGEVRVRPFPVPHDAEGITCGFVLTVRGKDREIRATLATDLGTGGNGLFEEFLDSDLILIESNYDPGMLSTSRRRDRARVDSDLGHLSNEQAGRFLARVLLESRRRPGAIVLCHLSADHNRPERAVETVRGILSRYGFGEVPVHAARRNGPSPRFYAL